MLWVILLAAALLVIGANSWAKMIRTGTDGINAKRDGWIAWAHKVGRTRIGRTPDGK